MAGELGILVRIVGAEVRPTALGACERALGDQARQQMPLAPESLEPGGVADEARVPPERAAQRRGHRLLDFATDCCFLV